MKRYRFLARRLAIVALLFSAVLTPLSQPVASAAPAVPQASTLDCSTTPFGRVLTLGAEDEIMVGFHGGFGTTQQSQAQFDRIDADTPTHLARTGAWASGSDTDTALHSTSWLTTVPADVDGDGTMEMVEVFNDSNNVLRTATHFNDGHVVVRQFSISTGSQYLAAAALTYGTNQRDSVVVAYRSAAGFLRVNQIDPIGETISRFWFTNQNNRANPTNISLATADLKGDGSKNDIIIAFQEQNGSTQLVVLRTTNDAPSSSNGTTQNGLAEVASLELGLNTPQSFHIATGDMDGDYHDEIVYAQENENTDSPGVSSGIALRTYDVSYGTDGTTGTLVERSTQDFSAASSDLALAMGDTARQGRASIVIGYHSFFPERLVVRAFDIAGTQPGTPIPATGLPLRERNSIENADNHRTKSYILSLAVGDMDRNGLADIVAAFRDDGQVLQVVRMTDQITVGLGLQIVSDLRDATAGRNGAYGISVHMADADNDSLKAHYATVGTSTLSCKQVVEPNLTSAVYVPPYWHNIQGGQYRYASIGESKSLEHTDERGITSFQSHSISAYFGGVIDAEAARVSVKVTAGYEFGASTTASGGDTVTKTSNQGWQNFNSFAVVDNTTYNCYTYQLRIDNQDVDGSTRFCQLVAKNQEAPSLDSWDAQNGPLNNDQALQWAPITRDWADLALFKGAGAVQSDGASNANLAVDGNTDGDYAHGSVTLTPQQSQPWWQVDLGTSQSMRHVRVWNRTDRGCGSAACSTRLANFYVFVSDVDPRSISNDPNVLKNDPRVHTYFHANVGGEVTNFLTLLPDFQPISGRYVRVQLADTGILSLTEVQVFGDNEVEPDRYPISVSDPDATTDKDGNYVPGKDGWFLATIYNSAAGKYEQVRVRGNLLWNGANDGVLQNKIVGPGDGIPNWSLTNERTTFRTQAEEFSQSIRVGAELEAEAGVLVKVQAGAGYEFNTGVTTNTVRTTSWGSGLEIGGGMQGFPTYVDGKTKVWPVQCKYGFQPFYYEVTDPSSAGFTHRLMVVDYTVPQNTLDRSANLAACRPTAAQQNQPSFTSDFTSGAPGSVFVLTAQNFPANAQAHISLKSPGSDSFREIASLAISGDGNLVFVLVTPQNAQPGDYTVRISTDAAQSARTVAAQSTVQEIGLTLSAAEPRHTDQPPGIPVVAVNPTIYLPLIKR